MVDPQGNRLTHARASATRYHVVVSFTCIYCGADTSATRGEYHVVSHAAGNSKRYRGPLGEIVLPYPLVCDQCNRYFGRDLDPAIAQHPYVLQWRAVYGMRSRRASAVYSDQSVRVETTPSGVLVASGSGIEIGPSGNLRLPRPALDRVDHFLVSRAVHKIALEYELLRIIKARGAGAARESSGPPLSIIARYVRRGERRNYRPYGVEGQGATRVGVSPFDFHPDPHGKLISPPAFTGYIIALPGARFTCVLAEDAALLRYMLEQLDRTEAAAYVSTRTVFWAVKSSGVIS